MQLRMPAVVCAFALLVPLGVVARPQTTGSTAIYRKAMAALGVCGADASCAREATAALVAGLGAQTDAAATGRGGPAAWLGIGAGLRGTRAFAPDVPRWSLGVALRALYASLDVTVDDALARDIDRQVARQRPDAAAAMADLVAALVTSRALAREAGAGSGIEDVLADPRRAFLLATVAGSGDADPALEAEWRDVQARIARVDPVKMLQAGLVLTDAVASFALSGPVEDIDLPFVFIGGEGENVHTVDRALSVDMGGADIYTNNAGGGLVAIAGGTLALDLGAGNDIYDGGERQGAQGFGGAGVGMLYDEGGSDRYVLEQFGQGGDVAGIGILYDAGGGNDRYTSPGVTPIGTKAASLGGISMLIDEGGDDTYRQDGLDGFDWAAAGGVALMADRGAGNDSYRADSLEVDLLGTKLFTAGPIQVSAEAGGATIFLDEGGDDLYRCGEIVRQPCQGGAGVGAFSLLWDRGGDDRYTMGQPFADQIYVAALDLPGFPMGQGAGYGIAAPAGPGIGILYDEAGDDTYVAGAWAQGFGSAGIGLLFDDAGGTDSYTVGATEHGARTNGGTWLDGALGIGIDR